MIIPNPVRNASYNPRYPKHIINNDQIIRELGILHPAFK
ncbi:hypothetical protein P20311_2721 [Pseudoalteromonas sp. BSi20311]|nr:hypothetical protein P20311_2721 [Pseudoalteromonas sp. BSi20311]